jgi:NAD+ kinase
VDSASRVYELSVNTAPAGAMAVIDGQITIPLQAGGRISMTRSSQTLRLARLPGHSYYSTLHRKLGWQGQLDYRERRG